MMNSMTAEILVEALPYIRKLYGKTIVIKYGGHAMTDPEIKEKVISDIILMQLYRHQSSHCPRRRAGDQ